MATRKAALIEGKARREERAKATAKRSSCVVRLMELEAKGIRVEQEAWVSQGHSFRAGGGGGRGSCDVL